ncbi:clostripain family protein [Lysobacter gummosus]|nr:clostripain family protein [Lysobacter gummosus]
MNEARRARGLSSPFQENEPMKSLGRALLATALFACCGAAIAGKIPSGAKATQAEWNVLVFMNGKNNLEQYTVHNWDQMAKVGSSDKVNILVEYGRIDGYYTGNGNWTGVKRYRVKKGDKPTAAGALMDLGRAKLNTDMGDKDTLAEFIKWGTEKYPAKRTMLVIWNHGQGFRAAPSQKSTHRSVSFDDQTGNALYNADVAAAIKTALGDKKLDIVSFDACLMAMIEPAYELRNRADFLVGSEELEPGEGWDYGFLAKLSAQPATTGAQSLGRFVVDSYRDYYTNNPSGHTTLSSIDLSKAGLVADALDSVAESLTTSTERQAARSARTGMTPYDGSLGVDIGGWLSLLKTKAIDADSKAAIGDAQAALALAVKANYSSGNNIGGRYKGDTGLAVFFPQSAKEFNSDTSSDGYKVSNTDRPISYVRESAWPGFLKTVFSAPTD